jgi:hypothetical protein
MFNIIYLSSKITFHIHRNQLTAFYSFYVATCKIHTDTIILVITGGLALIMTNTQDITLAYILTIKWQTDSDFVFRVSGIWLSLDLISLSSDYSRKQLVRLPD